MNKNIEKIWNEAAAYNYADSWDGQKKFMQKFSELLVKDCIELNKQELSFNAFERLMTMYREHFGVE